MITQIDTFVGIDPGSNGGFAWSHGGKTRVATMPDGKDKIKQLKEIQRFLKMIRDDHPNPCVFIERVQAWIDDDAEPGKKFGINKLVKSMTQITTTAVLLDIPFVYVAPVSWQSATGLRKRSKNETDTERKNRFKAYAQEQFPELDITLATADACCLLKFGWIKYNSEPDWIWKHIKNNDPGDLFG